jgi:hypothetical protein
LISEARRLQYLDAMGIDALVSLARAARMSAQPADHPAPSRDVVADNSGLYVIGPGTSQTLLLCQQQAETASRLASDIARCLEEPPVWGWQSPSFADSGSGPAGMDLETAIRDRLFTRVLVFGASAAESASRDEVVASARIIRAPAIPELANSAEHKRSLWLQLVTHGWSRRFA